MTDADKADKKKTKKDKLRSAWISFAGRIVAQLVGAFATVALGVMVLHRYTAAETRPPDAAPQHNAGPAAPSPQPIVIVLPSGTSVLHDALGRIQPADRGCTTVLDAPSTAELHGRPLLSR